MAVTHEFEHPTLGRMKGTLIPNPFTSEKDKDIIQFRSVPYGQISARFKQASLLTSLPENFDHRPHRDFTTYGTVCPQHARALTPSTYGEPLPDDLERPKHDEFSCLNVTISVPRTICRNTTSAINQVPVMAFIHGGAFAEGTSETTGFHDLAQLIALSIADGTPIVAVAINYRVGLLGNLACEELIKEQRSNRHGVNTSLHDQRTALQWIQRFISGFGGDPAAVTCFGQSAGGISTFMHLYSTEALFSRAVVQSGNVGAGWPTADDWESRYKSVLEYLNIRQTKGSSSLESLREVPVEKLIHAAQQLRMYPTYPLLDKLNTSWNDHGIPRYSNALEMLQNNLWCKEIMIGDMANEGFMFNFLLRKITFHGIQSHFSKVLGTELANKLLTAYEISSGTEISTFRIRAALLFGDLTVSEPVERIFSFFKSLPEDNNRLKCLRYRIDLPNPIKGALFEGMPGMQASDWPASHGYDLMYLLLTLIDRYTDGGANESRDIAIAMARKWVQFAHGALSQISSFEDSREKENAIKGVQISSLEEFEVSRAVCLRTIQEVYKMSSQSMSETDAPHESHALDQVRASLLDFVGIIKASM